MTIAVLQRTPGVHASDPRGQRPADPRRPGEGAGCPGPQDGGQRSADLQSQAAPAKGNNSLHLYVFPFTFLLHKTCHFVLKCLFVCLLVKFCQSSPAFGLSLFCCFVFCTVQYSTVSRQISCQELKIMEI